MKKIARFIGDRAKERSTWVGLVLLLSYAGVKVSPELQEQIITAGIAIGSAIFIFTKDL